jgi:hypothetical protein
MYILVVIGLMVVMPVLSILWEVTGAQNPSLVQLIGKWAVFWIVGIRLLTAGLSQMLRPDFTSRTIFEIDDPDAVKLVSELGISNIAAGALGVASLFVPGWALPAALYGFIFFALAGLRHIGNAGRNRAESVATVTDLWAAAVLGLFLVASLA